MLVVVTPSSILSVHDMWEPGRHVEEATSRVDVHCCNRSWKLLLGCEMMNLLILRWRVFRIGQHKLISDENIWMFSSCESVLKGQRDFCRCIWEIILVIWSREGRAS